MYANSIFQWWLFLLYINVSNVIYCGTLVCEHASFRKHACNPKRSCIKANFIVKILLFKLVHKVIEFIDYWREWLSLLLSKITAIYRLFLFLCDFNKEPIQWHLLLLAMIIHQFFDSKFRKLLNILLILPPVHGFPQRHNFMVKRQLLFTRKPLDTIRPQVLRILLLTPSFTKSPFIYFILC